MISYFIMTTLSYACLLLATFVFVETNALQCHKCNQATHPSSCNLTITCQSSETCYTNAYHDGQVVKYTMGCIDHHMCSQLSASSMPHVVGKRQLECHKCCSHDDCNIDLCSQLESGTCVDDEQEDCAKWDSLVQICQDVPHARLICPRYCNLCNITDGGWSTWSSWTACSVTCENGYRTRNRQCNNPTPSSLGEQCKGSSYERMNCSLQTCPVHGGWTTWSSWGACSVSCDIGIQRRDRSCANPYPSSDGDFCYGDSRDDRICSVKPCADGNWSAWSSWSVCSSTCGHGLQTRQRQCDNPKPSLIGSDCAGNPSDVSICFLKACHDGGWSVWGAWSTCSLTCGGGIHSRSRTCSNPAPSDQGQYCSGNPFEVETCNGDKCPEKMVPQIIFQARTLQALTLAKDQTFIFTNVMQNLGHGYNSTTGHFTAPLSGSYLFTLQYCVYAGSHLYYAIVVDNVIHTSGYAYDGNSHTCATGDALIILKAGQSVWVKATYTSQLYEVTSTNQNNWNIFSGMLLHE